VTGELYAEKTAPGVLQFVRASHGVDALFADLAQRGERALKVLDKLLRRFPFRH
jgi:hypothetical protein